MAKDHSLVSWAAAKGHQPQLVRQVLTRYVAADNPPVPRGEATLAILRDLAAELSTDPVLAAALGALLGEAPDKGAAAPRL